MDEKADIDKLITSIQQGKAHSLTGNRKLHKMKGSGRQVENVFENMEGWQAYSLAMAIKNHKALQLVDTAMAYLPEGAAVEAKSPSAGTVMMYRHGRPEYYKFADPLFYHAFNGTQGVTTDFIRAIHPYAKWYQNTIVRNPL